MLLKLWPIIGFQFKQFLHKCSIFGVVIGSIRPPCNGGVAVFSHIAPYNSSFQERNIPLVFDLNYFFWKTVQSSCLSRMILLAVCTSNFFQAIFLCLFRVLFTAFGTCLSSSTGFPVVSEFLTFEAPSGELGHTAQLSSRQ